MTVNEIYSEWLEYSKADLQAAQYLATMQKPYIEIVCYHCQQSAEKILKAFLIYHDIKPQRTHDLEKLRFDCSAVSESFIKLTKFCVTLNKYISHTRYPGPVELSEHDMAQALDYAQTIFDFVTIKLI